jgi:hypothetical protein
VVLYIFFGRTYGRSGRGMKFPQYRLVKEVEGLQRIGPLKLWSAKLPDLLGSSREKKILEEEEKEGRMETEAETEAEAERGSEA